MKFNRNSVNSYHCLGVRISLKLLYD